MSSPLSSLKKGSRSPSLPGHISGHRPIPFRHPAYSEDESRLLEEVTTNMAASRIKARDPFSGGLPTMKSSPNHSLMLTSNTNGNSGRADTSSVDVSDGVSTPPSDRELMTLMMTRLTQMEQKIQQQDHEIKKKDRRIKVLEDKLSILSKSRGHNSEEKIHGTPDRQTEHLKHLEQHCLHLQRQVHDMEVFLADYGMVWVGDSADSDSDTTDWKEQKRGETRRTDSPNLDDNKQKPWQPFRIDFDLLFENIGDLNVIAGEEEARVQHTKDGARLKRQEPVMVTFYANGMIMFQGPFRPYHDPATQQCMLDFLDGYFPSELQSRYPEGVPFIAKDMREVVFKPKRGCDGFIGTGNTLGGAMQSSRLVPASSHERDAVSDSSKQDAASSTDYQDMEVTSELPFRPITMETLLNNLPKAVIKKGKVIDIRDSVAKTLTGESSDDKASVTLVETDVIGKIEKAVTETRMERPKTPRDITTLRIMSEDGSDTYVVKLKYKETIGHLRHYLDTHRKGKPTDYVICSTYPRKVYTDDGSSMEDLGLKPNGVLHLQAKKDA